MRRRVLVAIVTFLLATADARGAPRANSPAPLLTPALVLASYATALATLRRPKSMAFEFTISQLGLHDMEQSHRAYRSGSSERDETLVVDGHPQLLVQIITNHTYRYDIGSVAPNPRAYAFTYTDAVRSSGGYTYVFRTVPRAKAVFAVSEIEIDGRTFLPAIVRFRVAGGGARGSGELLFGRSDIYWVIREATVTARLRDGKTARERIVWTKYRFPSSLPRSTFEVPKPGPKLTPLVPPPAVP